MANVQLPRLGNWFRSTGYVIRCDCWRCHVPVLRKRHWARLIRDL